MSYGEQHIYCLVCKLVISVRIVDQDAFQRIGYCPVCGAQQPMPPNEGFYPAIECPEFDSDLETPFEDDEVLL